MDFWAGLFWFVILPIIGFGVAIFFIVHWLVKKAIKDGTWQETFGSDDDSNDDK